ncbi:hypothetical protein M422DRAFT_775811 [Sphaerobolus stellatus SS14]|nr:hypothetical protein M422DRAFT_775811 [Sphaerobolus stellatus SS14]
MGAQLSKISYVVEILKDLYGVYSKLTKQVEDSPGIPVPNPSKSYWMYPPSPIATHGADPSENLPPFADIVIIGSGITGAGIARTLLESFNSRSSHPIKIVMLEARDACSGATGRNGGHINAPCYHDYSELKKNLGKEAAQNIIRFRLAHVKSLISIAEDEQILESSQCRHVDFIDVYFGKELFEGVKKKLALYCADFSPEEVGTYRVVEDKEELAKLQVAPSAVGCIVAVGGAAHPYRFVTGLLSRLLRRHPHSFHLFTQTPCTSIQGTNKKERDFYTVETPRGSIRTRHIIHATNGWVSHLLPKMRRKIVPMRAVMTAQRPGRDFGKSTSPSLLGDSGDWTGKRAFVFYGPSESQYDYLTQQPLNPNPQASAESDSPMGSFGELMYGGRFMAGGLTDPALVNAIGISDDSQWDKAIGSFLTGLISDSFGDRQWGTESTPEDMGMSRENWGLGRCLAQWSGVIGLSGDFKPWVGRIPERISRRPSPKSHHDATISVDGKDIFTPVEGLAAPGEWIAAGFNGEGMTNAWLSATALAHMILQRPTFEQTPAKRMGKRLSGTESSVDSSMSVGHSLREPLPRQYLINEERWKRVDVEDLLEML